MLKRLARNIPFLVGLLAAISGATIARGQEFAWAKQLGGASNDAAIGVARDASGNVYTVGSFQGTVDFDPGPGTADLTSAGVDDMFVAKLDAAGHFVWAKSVGGGGNEEPTDIAVAPNGTVYLVGLFQGTVDFDPGAGAVNLTAIGTDEMFVTQLDSGGNLVWAKSFSGFASAAIWGIAVDGGANVYTVGSCDGDIDFDPGPGTASLGPLAAPSAFISKLDASGNFVWVKGIKPQAFSGNHAWALDVAIDGSANVYTVGRYHGVTDFDPGAGTQNLNGGQASNAFISKLDTNGVYGFAIDVNTGGGFNIGYGVAVDTGGNIHLVGIGASANAIIRKYTSAGALLWAKSVANANIPAGVSVDANGVVTTVGTFSGTKDFDPGVGTYNLTSAGGFDVFISRLDAAGNFVWAGRLGGTDDEAVGAIAPDSSATITTVGTFSGTANFDPGPGVQSLVSSGLRDGFVMRLDLGPGAGAVPDGDDVSGVPLTISKNAGGTLLMSWGASCSGDSDYEVYEGLLGTFYSHVARLCSTGGATGAGVVPAAGDRYYLVVPATDILEGSYGTNSAGVERPPSGSACIEQVLASCP